MLTLEQIMEFLDWQHERDERDELDKQVLMKACDLIYEHVHKDESDG